MKKSIFIVFSLFICLEAFAQRDAGQGDVLINEFVAAPKASQTTEWVELYNTTSEDLDIGGLYIDDKANGGGSPKMIPLGTTLKAGSYYVFEFKNFLNNSGDEVRLLNYAQTAVYDSFTYTSAAYDKSYCRMPDGGAWSSSRYDPTKGFSNTPAGSAAWTPGNLEVYALKVGQGMSYLIVSPTGKTLLLDCAELNWNSDKTAVFVASEIRRITGGSSLDYILASHLHLDHIGYIGYGGIWSLIEEQGITCGKLIDRDAGHWNDINNDGKPDYATEIVYHNAGTLSNTARRWIAWVTDPKSTVYAIRETAVIGSTSQINLGEGITVTIVEADAKGVMMEDGTTPVSGNHVNDSLPPSENDYSITIWLNWNKFDFVFGGDTDGEYATSSYSYTYNDVETVVAQKINQPIEVVSVNHHGSDHSSNDYYVTTLSPQAAIYCTGANSYGHPSQRVLDLFYREGTKQYFTEKGDTGRDYHDSIIVNGAVVVKTADGVEYTVNGDSFTAEDP